MRIHVHIAFAAVLTLGLVSIGSAGGWIIESATDSNADSPAPTAAKPKPARWRVMTLDDATSTSRCIGDPKTPLCAVETLMACFIRRQLPLCNISHGYPASETGRFGLSKPGPSYRTEYRVVRFHVVSDKDPKLTLGGDWLKPGDIEITIYQRFCLQPRQSCVGEPVDGYSYVARRDGDRWRITAYAAHDAPD